MAALERGCLILAPSDKRGGLLELGKLIREQMITTLWLTAPLFHQIVDLNHDDLAGVQRLLTGGAAVSAPHACAFFDAFPEHELINGYGPTENTTFSTFSRFSEAHDESSFPIGEAGYFRRKTRVRMRIELKRLVRAMCTKIACRLVNMYGITETTVHV